MLHNQTDPKWLLAASPNDKGTGLFVIPDVTSVTSSAPDAATKVYVPGITYEQCIRRGAFAMVFKWIPDAVAHELEGGPCSTNQ
jgi:hypothetical protein